MLPGALPRLPNRVEEDGRTTPSDARGPADAGFAPGRLFAGHRISHEAGHGGMGVVYAAVHLRLQVTRALKVLTASAATDATFRARFER